MIGALPVTLHARAADWAQRFCEYLRGPWDAAQVERLHQQLDGLVVEAEARGEEGLSSAGLKLSSVLSLHMDRNAVPGQAQVHALFELTDAMMFASVDDADPQDMEEVLILAPSSPPPEPASVPAATPADGMPHRGDGASWVVSGNPRLADSLRTAFTLLGVRCTHIPPALGWSEALPGSGVQCVVVDADSLGVLLDLQRRSMGNASLGHARRPTYIAALDDASTSERVRALRAGADHVLRADEPPDALAPRLSNILSQRSEEVLSVLIIDDDPGQTLFCASILRRVGVNVLCCNDAASALRALRQELPDVMLVDLHMPDVDGLELTEHLLDVPGSEFTSVLFLSGDEEPDIRFDALTAGADDFLSKPIQPRHLIRAVLAHGKRSQRRRRAAAALHGSAD